MSDELHEAIIDVVTEQTQLTVPAQECETETREHLLLLISLVYSFWSLFAIFVMFMAGGAVGGCVMLIIDCALLLRCQIVSIIRHLRFKPWFVFAFPTLTIICYVFVYAFLNDPHPSILHEGKTFAVCIAVVHELVILASCIAFAHLTRTWLCIH